MLDIFTLPLLWATTVTTALPESSSGGQMFAQVPAVVAAIEAQLTTGSWPG